MRTMTARELKNRTGEVLRTARTGEAVSITLYGKPVAIVSPVRAKSAARSHNRTFEAAWKEIERALSKAKPAYRTWREAEDFSRGRR